MVTLPIEVYTDGSCARNPGPGGYGYIIKYFENQSDDDMPLLKTIEVNQGYRLTTNNRMEIMAAIKCMEDVTQRIQSQQFQSQEVIISSDSEYLCKAINQNWITSWQNNNWMTSGFQGRTPQPVKNKDLWEQIISGIDTLRNMGINLKFNHVKGHAGDEYNEKADQLATAATANSTNYLIDQVYENTYSQQKK